MPAHRHIAVAAAALALGLTAATTASATATAAGTGSGSGDLHLRERIVDSYLQDVGPKGPSMGDTLTGRTVVKDLSTGAKKADSGFVCTQYAGTTAAKSLYQCTQTYVFSGGTLDAAGVYDTAAPVLHWSITGGTGKYRGAAGQIDYDVRPDGASFDDTFHIEL